MLTLTATCDVYAQSEEKSLREQLIESENTHEVFAIDEYHTHVRPVLVFIGIRGGGPSDDFSRELASYCKTQLEIAREVTDPITGKTDKIWIPYDGKSYLFNYFMKDFKGFRCKGEFEVSIAFIKRYEVKDAVTSFIIKHEKPQPHVFKTEYFTKDSVSMPPDGPFKVGQFTVSGFFKALAGMPASVPSLTYQYLYTLCSNHNGTMRFIVNRTSMFVPDPYGRVINPATGERSRAIGEFVEVDALSAYTYLWNRGDGFVSMTAFIACEGNRRFVLRANEITARDGSKDLETYFASNRGLEGISYKPLAPSHSIVAREADAYSPSAPENVIALETAMKGSNVVKVQGIHEYVGIYNGKDKENCDLVTVERIWHGDPKKPVSDALNYRICRGRIFQVSRGEFRSLPDEIDAFAIKLAKVAQRLGNADGEFQGYTVKARALRDRDNCSVEVKILQGINLVANRLVNACQ